MKINVAKETRIIGSTGHVVIVSVVTLHTIRKVTINTFRISMKEMYQKLIPLFIHHKSPIERKFILIKTKGSIATHASNIKEMIQR